MRFDKWLRLCWMGIALIFVLFILPLLGSVLLGIAGFHHDFSGFIVWPLILFFPFIVLLFAIFIMSLIEVVTSTKDIISKILWILGMLSITVLALIAYYYTGRNNLTD